MILLPVRSLRPVLAVLILLAGCKGGGTKPVAPVSVTSVTVAPSNVPLSGFGSTASVSATIAPTSAVGTFTWQSDNPSVATVSGSGSSATVTATGGGTTTIRASVGTVSGSTTVTVTPIVRSISGPATLALIVGATTTPTIAFVADAGASQALTWQSSAPGVATVTASGLITAVAPGTATISASSVQNPSATAAIALTVNNPVVRGVTITPPNPSMLVGAARTLTAAVDTDAGVSTAVTWSSSASSIATVSATGVVTAVAVGSATIRATSVANPAVSGTTAVTVVAPTVRGVVVTPAAPTVLQGATRQLTAAVDADAGANTAVTWTSSAPTVASVSNSGLVTGLQPGTTTIKATSVLVPAIEGSVVVSVTAPLPLSVWTAAPSTPPVSLFNRLFDAWTLQNGETYAVTPLEVGVRNIQRIGVNGVTVVQLPFDRGARAIGGFGNTAWVGNTVGRVAQLSVAGDGTHTWTDMTSPVTTAIVDIVGLSTTTAVAMTSSRVMVLTGGVWTLLPAQGPGIFTELSATSTTDIVVTASVAFSGSPVKRWNGTVWTDVPSPPIGADIGALVHTASEVIVANFFRQSSSFNGTSWTALTHAASRAGTAQEYISSLTVCNGDVYAATYDGHRIWRRSGNTWTVVSSYGVAVGGSNYGHVWCGADNVLRSYGESGGVGRLVNGSWIVDVSAPELRDISIVSPTLAYAAGGDGQVRRWNGSQWSIDFADAASNTFAGITGVSAAPDGSVMAMPDRSNVHLAGVYHRASDGVWSLRPIGSDNCDDVYTSSSAFGIAVGGGCLYLWNGSTWQSTTNPGNVSFSAVDGASSAFAIAVGVQGGASATSRWDGTAWTQITTPNIGTLRKVRVLSPTLAYALSNTGLLRWNGTQWTAVSLTGPVAAALPLRDVAANSESEVYALAADGRVFLFNGSAWTLSATVSGATGDAREIGATAIATIPGFGIITSGSGGTFHSSTLSSVRAAVRRR